MEIGIGDRVRFKSGATEGVVYLAETGSEHVCFITDKGHHHGANYRDIQVLAKAHYQPLIEVGDKVMVLENGREGIVFCIDHGSTLPYSVGLADYGLEYKIKGLRLVDHGTAWAYSSKELKLIAKARYENPA